jgi:hypothetical protein
VLLRCVLLPDRSVQALGPEVVLHIVHHELQDPDQVLQKENHQEEDN